MRSVKYGPDCAICGRQRVFLRWGAPVADAWLSHAPWEPCGGCAPRARGPGWLVQSRAWPHIAQYLRVEQHSRTEDDDEGYFRLELEAPSALERVLWNLVVPCVSCMRPVKPFRRRAGGGSIYYAATCPLAIDVSCCRTAAARADHAAIVAALGGGPKSSALQPGLPGLE